MSASLSVVALTLKRTVTRYHSPCNPEHSASADLVPWSDENKDLEYLVMHMKSSSSDTSILSDCQLLMMKG